MKRWLPFLLVAEALVFGFFAAAVLSLTWGEGWIFRLYLQGGRIVSFELLGRNFTLNDDFTAAMVWIMIKMLPFYMLSGAAITMLGLRLWSVTLSPWAALGLAIFVFLIGACWSLFTFSGGRPGGSSDVPMINLSWVSVLTVPWMVLLLGLHFYRWAYPSRLQ